MEADGLLPDTRLLNTVLNGYARQLRWDRASKLLRRLTARGVVADYASYFALLRACAGARVPFEAMRALRLMREAGHQPDVRAYSLILSCNAKVGRLPASLKLLQQMRSEGLRPNGHVYAGLMEACIVSGEPHIAVDLFEQMVSQGVPPDVVSHTLLIRALLAPADGRREDGRRRRGAAADGAAGRGANATDSSERVAAALLGNDRGKLGGGVGDALRGGGEAQRSGGSGGSGESGGGDEEATATARALAVVRAMEAAGGASAPNELTYTAFIKGCVQRGAYELALEGLDSMMGRGLMPSRRTYAALTAGARPDAEAGAKAGAGAEAEAEAELRFYESVIGQFEARRLCLHADLYLPALRAATATGDRRAVVALLDKRRAPATDGDRHAMALPRALIQQVEDAEGMAHAMLEGAGAAAGATTPA